MKNEGKKIEQLSFTMEVDSIIPAYPAISSPKCSDSSPISMDDSSEPFILQNPNFIEFKGYSHD